MYDGKIVEIGKLCCVCIVAVAVVIIIIVLFLFVHVCITVESFSVNCLYMWTSNEMINDELCFCYCSYTGKKKVLEDIEDEFLNNEYVIDFGKCF